MPIGVTPNGVAQVRKPLKTSPVSESLSGFQGLLEFRTGDDRCQNVDDFRSSFTTIQGVSVVIASSYNAHPDCSSDAPKQFR
jgi:hypothetical protein